jgi:hypothetical protein
LALQTKIAVGGVFIVVGTGEREWLVRKKDSGDACTKAAVTGVYAHGVGSGRSQVANRSGNGDATKFHFLCNEMPGHLYIELGVILI